MTLSPDFSLSHRCLVTSDAQLDRLAEHLRPGLSHGDTVLLSGPIGAGKSHFARAVIKGFLQEHDALEDIPSPTFTLVQTYSAGTLEIWHSDLYRLTDLSEVDELGLIDAFDQALCLVEWPDRLGSAAPKDALHVTIEMSEHPDHRVLHFAAAAAKWRWLEQCLGSFGDAERLLNV